MHKLFFIILLLVSYSSIAEEVISIKLSGNLGSTWKERQRKLRTYHKATIENLNNNIKTQANIKIRGRRRAQLVSHNQSELKPICPFPPLKIKFNHDFLLFKKVKKQKFVSHCNDGEKQPPIPGDYRIRGGNHYLLREFYTYKIQNLFSKFSFGVNLANVEYFDHDLVLPNITRYGFFLERLKDIAKKQNIKYIKYDREIDIYKFSKEKTTELEVFNWFVGNTDYYISHQENNYQFHNVKVFLDHNGQYHPLAYDFNQTLLTDDRDVYRTNISLRLVCELIDTKLVTKSFLRLKNIQNNIFSLIDKSLMNTEDKLYFTNFFKQKYKQIDEFINLENIPYQIKKSKHHTRNSKGNKIETDDKHWCKVTINHSLNRAIK